MIEEWKDIEGFEGLYQTFMDMSMILIKLKFWKKNLIS